MILGLFEILLVGLINVVILAIPFFGIEALRVVLMRFLIKVKLQAYVFGWLVYLFCVGLGLLMAASIQLWLWQLVSRQDAGNWRMAVFSYAAGACAVMILRIYSSKTQSERRFALNAACLNTVLFTLIFAAAFASPAVYDGVRSVPNRVLRFVGGAL